jgi:hypothetical protein
MSTQISRSTVGMAMAVAGMWLTARTNVDVAEAAAAKVVPPPSSFAIRATTTVMPRARRVAITRRPAGVSPNTSVVRRARIGGWSM